jgi:MoaA/NifB/PqqE/SkfB family radical SAM enzyme
MNQAKIIIGFSCNNNCSFCCDKFNRGLPAKSTAELKEEIAAARKKGFSKVHFLGGEPTIRQDLFKLIEYARGIGFDYTMITTNGRMLAYRDFAQAALKAGLSQVVFSIHGDNARLHDSLTGSPGSFKELLKGVENLKKLGAENIGTNTVVLKQNYLRLPHIAKILVAQKIQRAEFIYVGELAERFKQFTPKISLASPYLRQALLMGKRRGYSWRVQNAPMPCYLNGYLEHLSHAGVEENVFFLRTRKAHLYKKAVSKKEALVWLKIDKCKKCLLQKSCSGILQEYLKTYGDKEVKPVSN